MLIIWIYLGDVDDLVMNQGACHPRRKRRRAGRPGGDPEPTSEDLGPGHSSAGPGPPELIRAAASRRHAAASRRAAAGLRRRMNNELNFPPNFERLVLGCIDADF